MGMGDAATIPDINDRCRTGFSGCRIVITRAVQALSAEALGTLLSAVRTFSNFSGTNDPHGEHDFGDIELFGKTWFWKFDYYNTDFSAGSEDPSDPDKTCRVLTILRSDEY
jgi:hypothetical protein